MLGTLIFATPRSGSTLAYETIAFYEGSTNPCLGLGEYFNFWERDFRDSGSGIEPLFAPDPDPAFASSRDTENAIHGAIERRIGLLRKYPARYCLKAMSANSSREGPIAFAKEQIEFLESAFEWIFVERENLFEQALSFAISAETGKWYEPGGLRLNEGSLEGRPEAFRHFEVYQLKYRFHRDRAGASAKVLKYEEFSSVDPKSWLKKIGFTESVDFSSFQAPQRQNQGDKLRFFRDPKKIMKLYRESFLQELHPI